MKRLFEEIKDHWLEIILLISLVLCVSFMTYVGIKWYTHPGNSILRIF